MSRIAIGIDPGASGSIAVLQPDGVKTVRMSNTEHDVADFLAFWGVRNGESFAFLERVHSMPKQGVSSSFKFGASYGFLKGLLVGMQIEFEEVTPQKWQKAMGCMTKGDKNVSKSAAQRLFPREKVVHATADAMLIAEFCRRELIARGVS